MVWISHTKLGPARRSEKVRWKSFYLTRKVNFTLQKNILNIKSIVILITLVTLFHVNQSHFEDTESLSGYMWTFMKVWQKSVLPKSAIFLKYSKVSCSNFDTITANKYLQFVKRGQWSEKVIFNLFIFCVILLSLWY